MDFKPKQYVFEINILMTFQLKSKPYLGKVLLGVSLNILTYFTA